MSVEHSSRPRTTRRIGCPGRDVSGGGVSARHGPTKAARRLLTTWQQLGITRHPVVGLLDRIWELRDMPASDAAYVALAETLDCPLLTANARLVGAPGTRCTIATVAR